MKARGLIARSLFLGVTCCLLIGPISSAHASDYLGQFCFQSQIDRSEYRLAATDMGDGHFLVNGETNAVIGRFVPIHGNAELGFTDVGLGTLSLTLTGGGVLHSGTTITGTEMLTINFNLDASTFNGSGEGIVTREINGVISTFAFSDTIINVLVFVPSFDIFLDVRKR